MHEQIHILLILLNEMRVIDYCAVLCLVVVLLLVHTGVNGRDYLSRMFYICQWLTLAVFFEYEICMFLFQFIATLNPIILIPTN